jgi:7,8-dihydropterin-6-yl-methyl-4-(beta-D-ribofuranosyl)aminobenzene 5'-phosphate synthase
MRKIPMLAALLVLLPATSISQMRPSTLSQSELDGLTEALKRDSLLARAVTTFGDPAKLYEGFKSNLKRCDSLWKYDQARLAPIADIGSTRKFELLPLIDRVTNDDRLIGENGVSYLIRTDDATILFDVGLNRENTDPSPLLKNMRTLGVRLDEIDIIVISHPHGDHIGGNIWEEKGTFSLTSRQIDLKGKRIYAPVPMEYPGLKVTYSPQPVVIAKGVATLGVIACPFFFGETVEQSLAVKVEGKGVIIISGCGHQTVEKLIQRTERLFPGPLYGLIGGLHLPMPDGKDINPFIKYFVTGRLPWRFLTPEDILQTIGMLKRKEVRLVGISGHDSSESAIASFRKAFGSSYVDIAVGKTVTAR